MSEPKFKPGDLVWAGRDRDCKLAMLIREHTSFTNLRHRSGFWEFLICSTGEHGRCYERHITKAGNNEKD